MISKEQIDHLLDGKSHVVGSDGQKIGSLGQIYVDDATGNPSWVTANTGLFGLSETFIPLDGAEATDGGIQVPYTKDRVKDAPNLDPNGHINEEEQDRLYEYYGLTQGSPTRGTTSDAGFDDGQRAAGTGTPAAGVAGSAAPDTAASGRAAADRHDGVTDGPAAEESLTRSEEQVNVGTERRETGKVRLRKYVVTENESRTVPVSREEVRVEREPITDAGRATDTELGDDAQEVTLHEETPVVEKRTVPVEEVRLEKDQVRDEETVDTEVRKEQIDTERDDPRTP